MQQCKRGEHEMLSFLETTQYHGRVYECLRCGTWMELYTSGLYLEFHNDTSKANQADKHSAKRLIPYKTYRR
jgi:hypothetical protein